MKKPKPDLFINYVSYEDLDTDPQILVNLKENKPHRCCGLAVTVSWGRLKKVLNEATNRIGVKDHEDIAAFKVTKHGIVIYFNSLREDIK